MYILKNKPALNNYISLLLSVYSFARMNSLSLTLWKIVTVFRYKHEVNVWREFVAYFLWLLMIYVCTHLNYFYLMIYDVWWQGWILSGFPGLPTPARTRTRAVNWLGASLACLLYLLHNFKSCQIHSNKI